MLAVGGSDVTILVIGGSDVTAMVTGGSDMTALAKVVSTGVFSIRMGTDGKCWPSSVAIGTCLM